MTYNNYNKGEEHDRNLRELVTSGTCRVNKLTECASKNVMYWNKIPEIALREEKKRRQRSKNTWNGQSL